MFAGLRLLTVRRTQWPSLCAEKTPPRGTFCMQSMAEWSTVNGWQKFNINYCCASKTRASVTRVFCGCIKAVSVHTIATPVARFVIRTETAIWSAFVYNNDNNCHRHDGRTEWQHWPSGDFMRSLKWDAMGREVLISSSSAFNCSLTVMMMMMMMIIIIIIIIIIINL